MAKVKETEYRKLCLQLAEADRIRKFVLNKIKQTPEYVSNYLSDMLTTTINKNEWFSRKNSKEEFSYFKLKGFNINSKTPTITKNGSIIFAVNLIWDYYDYNKIEKKECVEHVAISTFNDIESQILGGRVVSNFDEKKLLKAQLTEKKKKLENELKELKLELSKI